MKTTLRSLAAIFAMALLTSFSSAQVEQQAKILKLHNIFSSDMVLQRGKPISIWGWTEAGDKVSVTFGEETAEAAAVGKAGRWEVTFQAHEADAAGRKLTVTAAGETIQPTIAPKVAVMMKVNMMNAPITTCPAIVLANRRMQSANGRMN